MTQVRFFTAMAFGLWAAACGPSRPSIEGRPGSDALLDSLTSFAQSVQEDRFEKAFQCLSPSERMKFEAAGGVADPILQRKMKALRLSTLARRPTVKLERGGLVGIFEELPLLPSEPPAPLNPSSPPTSPTLEENPSDTP